MRSLPRIVSQIPSDVRNFLDRVREYLGEGGDSRFVTLGELRRGGIVGTTPGGTIIEPGQEGIETPKLPRALTATGAFATILVEWAAPDYLGHAYTEIWAAATDDFSTKELVGTSDGTIFSHNLGTGASRYYWIRFVNKLDVAGPFNATTGTLGQTSQDPEFLIDVLSDAYGVTGPAPFFQVSSPTTINGVLIPAGTYIKQAWIADATISRAKIQNLAVDNAKIADLAASKITAGSLQVGSYIESQSYSSGLSGWRVNADGTAEFAQAVVRGSIFGGGATSYAAGTGLFSGTDAGTYKFRVGNPAGNQVTWDGSALSITGTLLGGTATAYATGTGLFSGDVSGTYRWRVGNPTGARIQWTGSALEVYNASNVLTIASGDINYSVITGTKPPADATRNVVFRQTSTPTGAQVNDVWFNTSDNSTYYFNGSGWVKAGDVTSSNTAAAVAGQGSFATLNQIPASSASTYIAGLAIGTQLIANNATSQVYVGVLPNIALIGSTAGVTVPLPSFTVGESGRLVTQVAAMFHNVSSSTVFDLQMMNFVSGQAEASEYPILRLSGNAANAAFIGIGPNNTKTGSSAQFTTLHDFSVSAGQTIPVEVFAIPSSNNTGSTYLMDAYYIAVLYKK